MTRLRILTGGRQISWLFTSVAEKLNLGYREQRQLAVRTGFEPGTFGFHASVVEPVISIPKQIVEYL